MKRKYQIKRSKRVKRICILKGGGDPIIDPSDLLERKKGDSDKNWLERNHIYTFNILSNLMEQYNIPYESEEYTDFRQYIRQTFPDVPWGTEHILLEIKELPKWIQNRRRT
jgi:hypothetical protein